MLDVKENWLDNTIGFFSPEAKASRLKHKAKTEILKSSIRRYEGASKGRRTKNWFTPGTSADAETAGGLKTLRDRSRDLRRNNPYAARGIQVISSNVAGTGIQVQISHESDRKEKRMRQHWIDWAMKKKKIDFEGKHNILDMQSLIMESVSEGGDCLVLKRKVTTKVSPTGFQLQLLEGDFLDVTQSNTTAANGNPIKQGIEFDKKTKKVVAYHIHRSHPGENDVNDLKSASLRIDGDELLHIYRCDRIGQGRGIPWLAPVVLRIRDLDEYEDAQLIRQKIAACFAAFIIDMDTGSTGLTKEETDDLERVEPGMISKLGAGQDIRFGNPPTVSNYKEYTSQIIKAIAIGLGVSYEAISGDLSEVNFSSGRMGWIEFGRNVKVWQRKILISQFLEPVFEWFLESREFMGDNIAGFTAKYVPPKREMIDPTKEIPAKIKSVRAGFENLSDMILENGQDPDEHFKQRAKDDKTLDTNKFVFDSDARVVTSDGAVQQEPGDDGGENLE